MGSCIAKNEKRLELYATPHGREVSLKVHGGRSSLKALRCSMYLCKTAYQTYRTETLSLHNYRWIVLLSAVLCCALSDAFSQCNAEAGPATLNSCPGVGVTIGGNPAAGTPTGAVTYSWSPATGLSNPNVANPVANPSSNTTYTLTVTGADCVNETDQITVNVLAAPSANFTFAPSNSCANVPVAFTNTSTGCTGCSFSWDFGDPASGSANTSTLANPTHTFQATGNGTQSFSVTLTITSSNGCTSTITRTVTVNRVPDAVLLDPFFPVDEFLLCDGQNNVSMQVADQSIGTITSYTINWGDGSPNFTSSTAPSLVDHTYPTGIFTLAYTVVGANGCTVTDNYPVFNISNPSINVGSDGGTQACGPANYCFNLDNFSQNHPSTTYTINFGDGTPSFTVSHNSLQNQYCHTYTTTHCPTNGFVFSVDAVNGCATTPGTVGGIKVGLAPDANFTASPSNQCVNIPIQFINNSVSGVNFTNCNTGTTYQWNWGDGSPNTTVTSTATQSHVYTSAGTYTVTLTANHQQCGQDVFTQTVCIQNPPSASIGVNDNIICIGQTVSTTNTSVLNNSCSNSVGTWTVNYSDLPCDPDDGSWNFAGGSNATSLIPQFVLNSAGVYTLTYSITSACPTVTSSQQVTVNTVPVVSTTTIGTICIGQTATPSASVNDCNTPILSYAWSFPGGTPSSANTLTLPQAIAYNTAGSYTASFTATNECGATSSSIPVVVQAPATVSVSSNDANNTICAGSSIQLTAANSSNYSWTASAGGGLQSFTGTTVTAIPTSTATYTVTAGAAGCSDTETITITVTSLPVVQPSGTFDMCQGQTEQLGVTVTGGLAPYTTYSWNNASTLNNAAIANPVSSATTSTTYSVSVTDSNGCSGTGTVPLTVNAPPVVNAGPDIQPCNVPVGQTLTGFTPAGGTWSGTSVTPAGVFTPPGLGCVTLTYTYTNPTTGCVGSDQLQACVVNLTQANGGPDFNICIDDDPLPLTGPGTWSGCGVVNNVFTPTAVGACTLTYTVGSGSCASNDQVVVTTRALPTANAGPDQTICVGQTASLSATGTAPAGNGPITNYVWSGGSVSNPLISNPTITPGISGNITLNVTVVDSMSCSGQDQVTVFVNPLPGISAGPDITLCNQPIANALTGFSPAGGTWSGPNVTGNDFTPSGTGTFTLTYSFTSPATGCSNTDQMVITVTNAVAANGGADVELCLNQGNYQMVPVTPGGSWGPAATVSASGVVSTSSLGTFNLVYSIGQGTCLTSDNVQVRVNPLPVANAGPDQTICLGDTAQIAAFATGGTQPFSYQWTFPTTLSPANSLTPNAFPTGTTNYQLTVTDARGCQDDDFVLVVVNPLPVVEAGADITVCDQPIAEVLTGFGSPSPGTGFWYGQGITDPSGEFTSPGLGNYTVYYEFNAGGNNCTNTDSIIVTVVSPVIAEAGNNLNLCLNEGIQALSGFAPATGAVWSGAGMVDANVGIFDPTVAGAGTFTLTIAFGSGTCFSSDSIQVVVKPLPTVQAGPDQTVCGNALPFLMTGFVPGTGGVWEGTGIVDAVTGLFDPSVGPNTYSVFYHYTDILTQCSDTAFKAVNVSPVPVANFSVAPLGCTNANVDVVNASTGGTQFDWSYGNGDAATGFDPAYTYPDEGIFDIQLIVSNAFGCRDTAMNSNEIIDPPTSDAQVSPLEGCAPLDVSFGNGSTGQYVTYTWDLSIGSSTDTLPGALVYQQGADVVEYPVSLTVSNFCGTATDQETITVFPQPVAGFGTDLDVFCSPFTVEFNDISTGNPDVYQWNFGDGSPVVTAQEPVSHVFFADTIPVDYTIFLYLSNECGADTANYTITVLPNTVTAFFNTNITEGCSPLTVEFTDFSDGATQIFYDLGDGTSDGNDNPVHVYDEPGEYCIFQYADNGCSYDTIFQCIQVFASPEVDFTTDEPEICENGEVTFVSDVVDAVEMEWDFGDGGTSQNSQPTHVYPEPGNYTVTLTGIGDNGCTSTRTRPFTVNAAPDASFSVPSQLGCSPFTLCFSNISGGGNFYSWDYGDGNTSGSTQGCHTWENNGNLPELYTVSLIAQNLQLCADTFSLDIIVSPQPTAAFTLSSFESCYAPQIVDATNFSQYANNYLWEVNGAEQSDLVNESFVFDATGTYQVTLTASNSFGCSAQSFATYTIHPLPVADVVMSDADGCVPLTVNFSNLSSGAESYQWDFGDAALSFTENPIHTYSVPGVYPVTLIATSDQGCKDTLIVDPFIEVYNLPFAAFSFTPEIVNVYNPVFTFFDQSFDAHQWRWSFGDGTIGVMPVMEKVYSEAGTFPVRLEVWNEHGCKSERTRNVVVEDIFNVFVPNTFTPDGDGINEEFLPVVSGRTFIERYVFQIFDRWGTIVFETNDPDVPWLGDVREGAYFAKDGTYTWQVIVQLRGYEDERVYYGHVNLLR